MCLVGGEGVDNVSDSSGRARYSTFRSAQQRRARVGPCSTRGLWNYPHLVSNCFQTSRSVASVVLPCVQSGLIDLQGCADKFPCSPSAPLQRSRLGARTCGLMQPPFSPSYLRIRGMESQLCHAVRLQQRSPLSRAEANSTSSTSNRELRRPH